MGGGRMRHVYASPSGYNCIPCCRGGAAEPVRPRRAALTARHSPLAARLLRSRHSRTTLTARPPTNQRTRYCPPMRIMRGSAPDPYHSLVQCYMQIYWTEN
ncbi:uncharacterized protein LOC112127701 [Cimex lectularius]|uniref:Uncharacterized protein n=1 Tax=Cimex lectularius TaxID=79782 RepID=A0A8I6SLZ5_CIMLE|nr:uncharacterized protein LOC112127701 [Cimex lectularius]